MQRCGWRPGALAALLAAAPTGAAAHGGQLDWHAAPSESLLVLLPLLAASLLYAVGVARRGIALADGRAGWFGLAVLLLFAALVWPLDAWAELSFSAHMAQHMVLLVLAPPVLLLARPAAVWLRALPAAWRRRVAGVRRWPGAGGVRRITGSVAVTAALHGALLWGWHVPAAFELALRNDLVHWLEHVTLLGSGVLFWRVLLRARGARLGWGLTWTLSTVIHSGLLGALITLAPRPLYTVYAERGVVDAMADQQLAGLIMWVPMGTVYLLAALALAMRALQRQAGGREPAPE